MLVLCLVGPKSYLYSDNPKIAFLGRLYNMTQQRLCRILDLICETSNDVSNEA